MIRKTVTVIILILNAGCIAYRFRDINISSEPEGASVYFNDSLVGITPCVYQARIPFVWDQFPIGLYKPAAGENIISAYLDNGQQLRGLKILSNDDIMKPDIITHLRLRPMTQAKYTELRKDIAKKNAQKIRLIPLLSFDIVNLTGYYGFHNGGEYIDHFVNEVCTSIGGSEIDFQYFFHPRFGIGFTYEESVGVNGGYGAIIFRPMKTLNISYVSYLGKKKYQLFTLRIELEKGYDWSCAVEHEIVFIPPFPVEWKTRVGWITWEKTSGCQIATGLQVGLGWRWLKKRND